MSCRYRPLPIPGRFDSPAPCWQHPGLWTQSQSTLAARKGHLLFLTFLFPDAERSKDISLVAVPVISPNGCGPLAQGLGGKAAEGQGTSDLSLRQTGGKRDREVQSHPRDKGRLRVLMSSIGERGLPYWGCCRAILHGGAVRDNSGMGKVLSELPYPDVCCPVL